MEIHTTAPRRSKFSCAAAQRASLAGGVRDARALIGRDDFHLLAASAAASIPLICSEAPRGPAGGFPRFSETKLRPGIFGFYDTEVARLISAEKTTKKTKIQKSRPKKNTPGQRTSKYFQNDFITISDDEDEDDDEDGDAAPHSDNEAAELKVENKVEGSDEDEDEEWEDVEELADTSCVVPSQPVEIEIEAPEHVAKRLKREKRKVEFETYLRRMVNRFNKELFVDMHKVHLLCLVANGMFRSRLCSDPDLLAVALSLLPAHFTTTPPEEVTTPFLCGLLKW
uniref:Xeroderma pigmentosum, complementation group C n=1 Tax=Paramormyrops kingsleyae TaxID=1676925 RepID=A0A3B3SVR7_9TELE